VELARVPIVSGLLFSIAAGAGAAGNTVCPRMLKRWPAGQLIAMSAAVAAASALVLAMRPTLPVIFGATAAFGAAIGIATTAIYTTGGSALPERVRGAGFGLFASASLVGLAVSPIAAGILGALDIRAVFVADAAVMSGVAVTMARRASAAEPEPPHVSPGLPLE
jgi:MFS family permease